MDSYDVLPSTNLTTKDANASIIKENNILIRDIEAGNITVSTVIRKMFDNQKVQSPCPPNPFQSDETEDLFNHFLNSLAGRSVELQNDIEQLCHKYYQGFLDSMRQMHPFQERVMSLKKFLNEKVEIIQDSFKQLNETMDEFESCKRTISNIDEAIKALELCLPLIDQFSRAQRNIAEDRYFPALKTLSMIEHNQMHIVEQYDFSHALASKIPDLRNFIKERSRIHLTDFLQSVRKQSVRLGAIAMNNTAEKIGFCLGVDSGSGAHDKTLKYWNSFAGESEQDDGFEKEWERLVLRSQQTNGEKETLLVASSKLALLDGGEEECRNLEDLVDFSLIYRCLHIHTVLGNVNDFQKRYRTQRKSQLSLCFSLAEQQKTTQFLSSIVGFFIVEDFIFYTLPGLMSRSSLDELWIQTATQLTQVFEKQISLQKRENLLLLKNYLALFSWTMRSLGFSITPLKTLFELVKTKYLNLLLIEWSAEFKHVLQNNNYSVIILNNQEDFIKLRAMYPCKTPKSYPTTLSFSPLVPQIFHACQTYMEHCRDYCVNLELSQTEMEDMLSKACNAMYTQALQPSLYSSLRELHFTLSQLVQFSVNMDVLESSCTHLEDKLQCLLHCSVINSINNSNSVLSTNECPDNSPEQIFEHSSSNHICPRYVSTLHFQVSTPSRLQCCKLFRNVRSETESQIYSALYDKIDSFFVLSDYDRLLVSGTALGNRVDEEPKPSGFVVDMMNFLNASFHSFTNLSSKVAQTAFLLACKHICQSFQNLLNDSNIAITDSFLRQVSVDLEVCESFTDRLPTQYGDVETLKLSYVDLRELLNLVLLDDWDTYFKRYGTESTPYARVTPNNAIRLLERTEDAVKKRTTGFFQNIRKNTKNTRPTENIIRKLREIKRQE